jgi:hypothetical protein
MIIGALSGQDLKKSISSLVFVGVILTPMAIICLVLSTSV